ncbi:MAG: hypothetical protein ACM3UY_06875 [Methanocella sp.]
MSGAVVQLTINLPAATQPSVPKTNKHLDTSNCFLAVVEYI